MIGEEFFFIGRMIRVIFFSKKTVVRNACKFFTRAKSNHDCHEERRGAQGTTSR